MTKQEQIEEMTKLINSKEIYPCEDDVHCENCFCSHKDTAERLYSAGYRKVLLDTENGSCVDCIQYAPWQLVERKIEELKSENKQLKTECALLDDELRIARQDTIDVLNELKEKFKGYEAWYYNGTEEGYHDLEEEIDEFIKELS